MTTCENCSLNHKSPCNITKRRRRLAPLPEKKRFWDGVLTRTQLAQKTNTMKLELKMLKKEKADQKSKSDTCVICQDVCLESAENSTPCGHTFHTGCLLPWLKTNNTCPCCRASLYDKPEIPTQNDIQNLVENVLTMHLNIDPTADEITSVNSGVLYTIGDEIARLAVEESLDIDLNWFQFDDDMPDLVSDGDEDTTSNDTSLDTSFEAFETFDTPSHSPLDTQFETPMDTIFETPSRSTVIPDLDFTAIHELSQEALLTPTENDTVNENFINVIRELRSRNSFMTAWNNIDTAHGRSV